MNTTSTAKKPAKRTPKPLTNTELVGRMMTFSRRGALSQLWIIDALIRESKRQALAGVPNWPDDCMMNPEAWHDTACEILETFKAHGYTT